MNLLKRLMRGLGKMGWVRKVGIEVKVLVGVGLLLCQL